MLHVWYIYLHLGDFVRANVGKYSSTMERMGVSKYDKWTARVGEFGPRIWENFRDRQEIIK
jgi:hypothetical protein